MKATKLGGAATAAFLIAWIMEAKINFAGIAILGLAVALDIGDR